MAPVNTYIDTRCITPVTITSGTATTPEIDLGGTMLTGIVFPATMTSATLKISMATISGGTYQTLQTTAGADLQFSVTAGKTIVLDTTAQAQLVAARFIKIVVASNEGADRSLQILSKTFS